MVMAALTPERKSIIEASDVDDALIEDALDIADGWYSEGPIDWEDLIDRLEGTTLDFGVNMDSQAIRKIQREVRFRRRL